MWELWRVQTRPFGGYNPPRNNTSVSILGVPLDETSSLNPGTRFAPESIRKASESLEWYSYTGDRAIPENGYYDEGDILAKPGDVLETLKRLEKAVEEIALKEKRKIIVLGGEHTILYGTKRLLDDKTLLVVFDAHADLRDEYLNSKLNHATVLRRVLEEFPSENVVLVGTRALSSEEEAFVRENQIRVFTSRRLWSYGTHEVSQKLKAVSRDFSKVYISLDMDVLDPSYAPGVGTPEPLGLDPHSLMALLGSLLSTGKVVGLDVVETNPLTDSSNITSFLAAKIVIEALAFLVEKK